MYPVYVGVFSVICWSQLFKIRKNKRNKCHLFKYLKYMYRLIALQKKGKKNNFISKPVSIERQLKSWYIKYNFKWNQTYLSCVSTLSRCSMSLNSVSEPLVYRVLVPFFTFYLILGLWIGGEILLAGDSYIFQFKLWINLFKDTGWFLFKMYFL